MTAQATPAPPRATIPLGTADRILMHMSRDEAGGQRRHAPPKFPPGVVPSGTGSYGVNCDSAMANYGWLNGAGGAFCGLGFPGYQYLAELFQRSEYRAPVETIANEMTRKWIRLQGGDEAKRGELEEAFRKFAVRECCRLAVMHDGAFGRGQIYIVIKGQDNPKARAKPLNIDEGNIAAGSLVGFKNIEPVWTTPLSYNSNDPTQPDFYRPVMWYIMGVATHTDRLLTFISRPLPDILKPSYNFSGLSLQQLIEPYVQRWLKTVDSINRLLSRFSFTYLKTNLMSTLQQPDGGAATLTERARIFTAYCDMRGLGLIDFAEEDFGQLNTPLSGLSELQAQSQEHMAAPTHIPLVVLTGITPAGLNASSEGEIEVFNNYIAGEQRNLLDSNLRTMMHIVMLHLWGKVDDKITFEWVPLSAVSEVELGVLRKDDAAADVSMVGAGVLDPLEVRERLRNDPNSGYTFIEPGDVPPPPLEAEAAVGEEGKQADHERAKEDGEVSHERAMELEKTKAKNKPKPASDDIPSGLIAWWRKYRERK
jgi:phage-related protein (TIGR01555 family)